MGLVYLGEKLLTNKTFLSKVQNFFHSIKMIDAKTAYNFQYYPFDRYTLCEPLQPWRKTDNRIQFFMYIVSHRRVE